MGAKAAHVPSIAKKNYPYYKAKYRTNLLKHLESIHEGVKYLCDQCDYKATRKTHLLRHLKSKHEGVKYPCDQCDFKASQKSNLLTHIKSKHEGKNFFVINVIIKQNRSQTC